MATASSISAAPTPLLESDGVTARDRLARSDDVEQDSKRPKLMRQLTMGENELKEDVEAFSAPITAIALDVEDVEQQEEEEEAGATLNLAREDSFNVRSDETFSSSMFLSTPRPYSPSAVAEEEEEEEASTKTLKARPRLERVESWQEDVTDSSWRAW